MHRRAIECKFAADKSDADEQATFSGLGSVFGNVDGGLDVVERGAFADSLKERWPKMLLHHGWGEHGSTPVGKWDSVKETANGLEVKGTLFLETDTMRLAYRGMKEGVFDGLSIGYVPKVWEIDQEKQVRKLKSVELYEISLVTFPMNENALIGNVKSRMAAGELVSLRDLEDALREAGFSRSVAKALAKGYDGLTQREAAPADGDELKKLIGKLT
jgi:hypothetical protein